MFAGRAVEKENKVAQILLFTVHEIKTVAIALIARKPRERGYGLYKFSVS